MLIWFNPKSSNYIENMFYAIFRLDNINVNQVKNILDKSNKEIYLIFLIIF